jgi:hypothetical protein
MPRWEGDVARPKQSEPSLGLDRRQLLAATVVVTAVGIVPNAESAGATNPAQVAANTHRQINARSQLSNSSTCRHQGGAVKEPQCHCRDGMWYGQDTRGTVGGGILTIQLEQVEGIQERLVLMAMGMELVEIRLAVPPSPNRFPVHDDEADPKGPQRLDYPRILGGPIVAPVGCIA